MITLFTGMPGAGKTAAMVDVLRQLAGDRPIFVHFDAAAKRRPDQVLLHESLTIPHQACNANTWWEEVPDGGILVIDEVQDVWRPRGPGSKVPEGIAQLETHRHAGIDVFLTTQAPRLCDANVRGLVGRHVHIRDTGFLGRMWYEWPECNESMTWKTCVNKHKFKVPKAALGLYQSANVHTKPVRSTPVLFYMAILAVLGALALTFLVYRIMTRGSAQPDESVPAVRPTAVTAQQHGTAAPAQLDERTAFLPRIAHRPETAPAYDHLRQVIAMPVVTGAICINGQCVCHTQQATNAGLSSAECANWAERRPFNPYQATERAPDRREAGQERHPAPQQAQATPGVLGVVTGAL